MNKIINQVPYLRSSRQFPEDIHQLCVEVNRSYIDIANAVNNRTISIFPSNLPAVTGESWYLNENRRQQTFRKAYSFGTISSGSELDIPTGITDFVSFTRIWGVITTNVVDYRPIPYIDVSSLDNGVSILVGEVAGMQQIRIILGVSAPPVTSGIAVLEYLTNI